MFLNLNTKLGVGGGGKKKINNKFKEIQTNDKRKRKTTMSKDRCSLGIACLGASCLALKKKKNSSILI